MSYIIYITANIVNFYEISEWQYKYLNIWCTNPDIPYITTQSLYNFLHIKPMVIIEYYFAIYGIL